MNEDRWYHWIPKIKDIRINGLLLAFPLTIIGVKLIDIPEKSEAVWLAIGGVVGAFANSIVEAFKDSPPPAPPAMTESGAIEAMKIAAGKTS